MDMRKFQQMKSEILRKLNASVYTDKSPKGFLDAPIVELVNLLNSHKDYVTTSSCSGRIVLYATLEKKLRAHFILQLKIWFFISSKSWEDYGLKEKL